MVDLVARLGLRYPIVQAPMAGVQGSRLAVAVSEAGGLGSLPAAMLDAPALEAELTTIRARTGRPVNINFFCHALPADDEARQRAWHAALAPYYREFGLERRDAPDGASRPASSRRPFDHDMADVLAPFRPAVVSFHFGLPAAALVDRLRASGTIVLASATTVDEARWLEAHGADVVIAQGIEAGGHRGHFLSPDLGRQKATLVLLDSPAWLTPMLKLFFTISYVVLAPFVGAFADSRPKGHVMFISNTIKVVGCLMISLVMV